MAASFNSFTGFHGYLSDVCEAGQSDFQFLHRIPPVIRQPIKHWLEIYFQFLHRIPPPFSSNIRSISSSSFNSFTGFHYGLFPGPDVVPAPIFQFLHRIPRADAAGRLRWWSSPPFNSFTGFHVGRQMRGRPNPFFFQFLHRIPQEKLPTRPPDSESFQFLHRIPQNCRDQGDQARDE